MTVRHRTAASLPSSALLALLALLVSLALAPSAARAAGPPGDGPGGAPPPPESDRFVLVPAHAERIQAMLRPIELDRPFGAGCLVPSLSLERTNLRFTVTDAAGAGHTLIVGAAAAEEPAPPGARASASFRGHVAELGAGDPWPACVVLVWQRLRSADDGTFWAVAGAERVPVAADEGPFVERWALPWYRLLQIVCLLVIGWGVVRFAHWDVLRGALPRADTIALGAAVVTAVVLRLVWAEAAFIHENSCGVGRVACAAEPPCHGLTGTHSWVSFAFYNLVLTVSGGASGGVFAANVVLMAVIQPLLVFALGRELAGTRRRAAGTGAAPACAAGVADGGVRAGVYAAWALAILPIHVRMSPTASYFPWAVTLLLASILAVRAFARRGGVLRALGAAVLVALLVQTSKVFHLFPPLALLVFLLARPVWSRRTVAAVGAGVVAFAALTSFHHVELLQAADLGAASCLPEGPLAFLRDLVGNNLLLDPAVTPLVVALAWLFGAGVLLVRRPREGAALLAVTLVFGAILLAADRMDGDYPTRVRFQVSLAPFSALFAGAGLAFALRRRAGVVVTAAAALLSLVALPRQHAFVGELLVPALEARFLDETIPRLPPVDVLVTVATETRLPDVAAAGDPVETHFPWHELRRHQPGPVEHLTVPEVLSDPSRLDGRRAVFYQAANAWAWLPEELAALPKTPDLRRRVRELHDKFELRPITGATGELPNTNPPAVRYRFTRARIPVGFYELATRQTQAGPGFATARP